eukprot:gb/GEZN01006974.1/.p1 GENE.gb/GEZN01006974.1/~~gb/GEZN01006974.1/.p1  ORF type:complete len:362 (-),score=33.46 gb/GEZN01006974.1/:434-1519(-)
METELQGQESLEGAPVGAKDGTKIAYTEDNVKVPLKKETEKEHGDQKKDNAGNEAAVKEENFSVSVRRSKHGADGLINVTLAAGEESLSIFMLPPAGPGHGTKAFEGVIQLEGSLDTQDIRDACDAFRRGSINIRLDKLKITGVGFQVKLREVDRPQEKPVSVRDEISLLRSEVESLSLELQLVKEPLIYDVPLEELRAYGWETDAATKYGTDGKVAADDSTWRGAFTGKVRALLWCNCVMLEGQVSGVGRGMRKHSERRLGTTAYSEVAFPIFRLPVNYRPQKVESFSRRPLDIGTLSSDYIGGIANGSIGYRPLRRLDVLPDGFVVLICCLHVKTKFYKFYQRPTRWFVHLHGIQFFPQ